MSLGVRILTRELDAQDLSAPAGETEQRQQPQTPERMSHGSSRADTRMARLTRKGEAVELELMTMPARSQRCRPAFELAPCSMNLVSHGLHRDQRFGGTLDTRLRRKSFRVA